jgi:hypothetical protein
MDKRQVQTAVGAGLELLGEKSDIEIPVRLTEGVFYLNQLLILIASGKIGLAPTVMTGGQEPVVPPKKTGGKK